MIECGIPWDGLGDEEDTHSRDAGNQRRPFNLVRDMYSQILLHGAVQRVVL